MMTLAINTGLNQAAIEYKIEELKNAK